MPDGVSGGPGGVVSRLMSAYACPSDSSDYEDGEEFMTSEEGDDADAAPGPAAAALAAHRRAELSPEERQWRAGIRGAPPRFLAATDAAAAAAAVPLLHGRAPGPLPPCSFLRPGAAFCGTQRVCPLPHGAPSRAEAWRVNVRIHAVDLDAGTVCGSMEAVNVPSQPRVETLWEGQLVDGRAHGFRTGAWGADAATDLRHWAQFPAFAPLRQRVARGAAAEVDCGALGHVFMRWKETAFLNCGPDCGLTIAGFYYVCLSRADGAVSGYYFDPASAPFQQLALRPSVPGCAGAAAMVAASRRGQPQPQPLPGGGPQCFAELAVCF